MQKLKWCDKLPHHQVDKGQSSKEMQIILNHYLVNLGWKSQKRCLQEAGSGFFCAEVERPSAQQIHDL